MGAGVQGHLEASRFTAYCTDIVRQVHLNMCCIHAGPRSGYVFVVDPTLWGIMGGIGMLHSREAELFRDDTYM